MDPGDDNKSMDKHWHNCSIDTSNLKKGSDHHLMDDELGSLKSDDEFNRVEEADITVTDGSRPSADEKEQSLPQNFGNENPLNTTWSSLFEELSPTSSMSSNLWHDFTPDKEFLNYFITKQKEKEGRKKKEEAKCKQESPKSANQQNPEMPLILEQFKAFRQEMSRKISAVEQKLDNEKERIKQKEEKAENKQEEELEEELERKDDLDDHLNSSQTASSTNTSKFNNKILLCLWSPMIIGLLLLIVLLVGGTLLSFIAPPVDENGNLTTAANGGFVADLVQNNNKTNDQQMVEELRQKLVSEVKRREEAERKLKVEDEEKTRKEEEERKQKEKQEE